MEEAIAIVTKYRNNVLGMSMCEQIQRAVLNSILEDLHNAQQSMHPTAFLAWVIVFVLGFMCGAEYVLYRLGGG